MLIQLDYSENWLVKHQNYISAPYFNSKQVSILPLVMYYQEDEELKTITFVGVNEVTAHSVPTTIAFIKAMLCYAM